MKSLRSRSDSNRHPHTLTTWHCTNSTTGPFICHLNDLDKIEKNNTLVLTELIDTLQPNLHIDYVYP